MNSSNPTLRPSIFQKPIDAPRWEDLASSKVETAPGMMTIRGTAIKTGFMLAICVTSAMFAWSSFYPMAQKGNMGGVFPWMMGSALGGMVVALIITFKMTAAPFLAPIYAALQGVVIASMSLFLAAQVSKKDGALAIDTGMIFQAASLTFGIAGAALIAYASGLVRLSGAVQKMIVVATGGVALYAVAMMLLNGVFNMGMPNLWSSASPLGIGFSLFVIGLASFTLVMDYQVIDEGARSGQPKYMEWYGAFALTVTLVWLYIEILRLLSKLNRRD